MEQPVNILMCLMKLDIGGAETHVVELSKELKRRGYNVIAASNGGVYVKELENAGIKHYNVPLQNKNPFNVIKAFKQLRNIIKNENITIVHSHARIPSFILGRIRRKMNFHFVTTAHWVFSTKYGLKYITDWGEKTIAVSEDIKRYLMDNYHTPEKDIFTTINGIDTEKFSPNIDCSGVKAEFDIKAGERVIVNVSRLDESRSLAAKQLISVCERLNKKTDGLRVIIVGDGDDFAGVSAMADEVNKNAGRNIITLTGSRVDINRIIAAGELFVGVSRAVLEAMACQKPVIITGNEGYIGLFSPDKLDTAKETNFCCRFCPSPDAEMLYDDIMKYFSLSEKEKNDLAEFSRKVILSDYSAAKMADDTIMAYDALLGKH